MYVSTFAIATTAVICILSQESFGFRSVVGSNDDAIFSFVSSSAVAAAVTTAEQRELQGAATKGGGGGGKGTEGTGNKGNKNDDKGENGKKEGTDVMDDGDAPNAPKDRKKKKLSSEYVVDIPPSQRTENAGQRPKSKDDEDLAKIPANVTAGGAAPYDPARAKMQTNVLDPDGNVMTDSDLDELYAAVVIDGMTLTPGGLDTFILGGREEGGGANDTQYAEDAESENQTFDSIMSERLPVGSVRPDKGKALGTEKRPGRDKVVKPSNDKSKGVAGGGGNRVGGKISGNGHTGAGAGKSSSETKRHLQTSVENTASIGTFKPLTCNSALASAGCSSPLSSLSWDGTSKLVVPCGESFTYVLGANVTMPKGLDVVGKLR